jgi:hypothetical protein
MSERSGRGTGRGGRGNSERDRGRGRGHDYSGTRGALKSGLCAALGSNVFDYGHKAAADQMRITVEKIVQYVGTNYGQDICNELRNKTTVILPEPVHTAAILTRHATRSKMIRDTQKDLQDAREEQKKHLEAEIAAGDIEAKMKLALLKADITAADYQMKLDIPIELTEEEKTSHSNAWKSHRERNQKLLQHRALAFSLILGQCTHLLEDKMKQDSDWLTVNTSFDPLALYRLIEKITLAQSEDQYPFAMVYAQEQAFYSFKQDSLSNPQWYDRFNTKVDIGTAIGVTRQHKVLLEYVAMELHHQAFDTLGATEQQAVREDAEERYISFAFLSQSAQQHGKLKEGLKDDYTKGVNQYPKTRQQTLHLLDNHSKTSTPKPTPSEGTSFAQKDNKGDKRKGDKDDKDTDPKAHRARKGKGKQKQKPLSDEEARMDDDDDNDEESRSSNESRSSQQASRSSQARSKKVAKDMQKDMKHFV